MVEGLVGRMQETRNAYKILVGQFQNRSFVTRARKGRAGFTHSCALGQST
jgi:hypothetical protein